MRAQGEAWVRRGLRIWSFKPRPWGVTACHLCSALLCGLHVSLASSSRSQNGSSRLWDSPHNFTASFSRSATSLALMWSPSSEPVSVSGMILFSDWPGVCHMTTPGANKNGLPTWRTERQRWFHAMDLGINANVTMFWWNLSLTLATAVVAAAMYFKVAATCGWLMSPLVPMQT